MSSLIQLQMPCRPTKSKSGRSSRAQNSAKDWSKSRAPLSEVRASERAKAAWAGLKSVPNQKVSDAAAWIFTERPCPKPSSHAVATSGTAMPACSRGRRARAGFSSA